MREQKKSLFIIGAGASKDFKPDFPTGEELINKLKKISMDFVENQDEIKSGTETLNSSPKNTKGSKEYFYIDFNSIDSKKKKCSIQDKRGRYISDNPTDKSKGKKYNLKSNTKNELEMLLNILLCNLINLHKPKSIDYYVGIDLINHISNAHIKKFETLGYKFDGKDIIKMDSSTPNQPSHNQSSPEDEKEILDNKKKILDNKR